MGGRKCCVPGCDSNYQHQKEYTTVFQFPNELGRKEDWVRRIHRADFQPSKTSVVCIKHFAERFISREISVTTLDGKLLTLKRKNLALTKDAYPSIFENQPSYMTTEVPQSRNPPEKRFEKMQSNQKKLLEKIELQDQINSFKDFSYTIRNKVDPVVWHTTFSPESINIFKASFENIPKISICITIKVA